MKSKEIYEAIDLNKVDPNLKTKLITLEKVSEGFTNERADPKMDAAMNGIYDFLKKTNPSSLKNIEVESVEVKEEVKTIVKGKVVKKTATKKKKVAGKKKKVVNKTKTPSSGVKKQTVSSVASKIRKPGEAWNDALKRAKVIFNEKKDTKDAIQKKAIDDLKDFLSKDKNFAGWPRTYGKEKPSDNSLERDSQRIALPPGKRISKTGKVYYENRDNRSDREANSFPRKIYLKEGGNIYNTRSLFELGGESMVDPTILQNNPNYLTSTMSMRGLFAKGGNITSRTTYIPNRSIKELTIELGKKLKTLKGTDIVDGVYAKNSALKSTRKSSMNSIDGIIIDLTLKAMEKGREDDLKIIKKNDIEKLLDAGYNGEEIMGIYLGPTVLTNVNIDNQIDLGLLSNDEDYISEAIESFVEAAKNKTFELGLKYPDYDWSDIIKKYKIDISGKDVNGKERTNKTSPALVRGANASEFYVYRIYEGDKVVVGTVMDRVRIVNGKKDDDDYFRRDPEDLKNFKGGYWGIVSSDKKIIMDIAKMILSKKTGYIKNMEIFVNGLGGLDAETLDENKIAYELGGETMIMPTIIQNNPNYLVSTTTYSELFEKGGSISRLLTFENNYFDQKMSYKNAKDSVVDDDESVKGSLKDALDKAVDSLGYKGEVAIVTFSMRDNPQFSGDSFGIYDVAFITLYNNGDVKLMKGDGYDEYEKITGEKFDFTNYEPSEVLEKGGITKGGKVHKSEKV